MCFYSKVLLLLEREMFCQGEHSEGKIPYVAIQDNRTNSKYVLHFVFSTKATAINNNRKTKFGGDGFHRDVKQI